MCVFIFVNVYYCRSGANKGYAFVNFTNPESAYNFYLSAQNHAWADFRTNKICQIAIARLQVLVLYNLTYVHLCGLEL